MDKNLSFAIEPNPQRKTANEREAALRDAQFGQILTDHMATILWSAELGWHKPRISAQQPLPLSPAAAVLHYGLEIFEGMKAYKNSKGEVFLFRPQENARRFVCSAERLCLPALPEELFIRAVEELVRADAAWIPQDSGGSLYLRPFLIATEAYLGVRVPRACLFCVIASPARAYFHGGAIRVWVEQELVRAAKGGTGEAKCGGNYAGAMKAQQTAAKNDCAQVVFLDAAEHKFVEEMGGMNLCFVLEGDRLVTPPLSGTILRGITRASLLDLARHNGMQVEERPYSFAEWRRDAQSGVLKEAFACGTAAVVCPIGEARWQGGAFAIGAGVEDAGEEAFPITRKLKAQLLAAQHGESAAFAEWAYKVALR